MKRPKGFRSRTRKKLRKHPRNRGKISISRLFQKLEKGDKVVIDIEPSYHKGMPHPRYQGRLGIIEGKIGRAYVVLIKDGGKIKKIYANPIHLKKI